MPNPVAANVGGYRPDLDGLRGIAVAAVVAYHLELPFATGGFVGVDVFFVLSGYLITRLIAEEMRSGAFSLTRFYERRIRRIVPAMVFVCACTTAMAIAFLLPDELKRYSSSLIAAAFSYSNVWFFDNSGYFDPGSGTQPLLHTWSLGIEEQFYIVFPLLLLAVFRWRPRALGTVIWLAFAASLVASVVLLPEHPAATFYLLHTRAWELLTGSILALGLLPRPASQAQREIAFAAGIVAIAVAVFGFASKTPFPGASALLPCIGTALAIWASEGGEAAGSRFLKFRPLMFLGLISYSLYLWHWPLIVFTKLAGLAGGRDGGARDLHVALRRAALSPRRGRCLLATRHFRERYTGPRRVGGLGMGVDRAGRHTREIPRDRSADRCGARGRQSLTRKVPLPRRQQILRRHLRARR